MRMRLAKLLVCHACVASVCAASIRLPIHAVARDTEHSTRSAMFAAEINGGQWGSRSYYQNVLKPRREQQKEQKMRSGPIGGVENDGQYLDIIEGSSTMTVIKLQRQDYPLRVSIVV